MDSPLAHERCRRPNRRERCHRGNRSRADEVRVEIAAILARFRHRGCAPRAACSAGDEPRPHPTHINPRRTSNAPRQNKMSCRAACPRAALATRTGGHQMMVKLIGRADRCRGVAGQAGPMTGGCASTRHFNPRHAEHRAESYDHAGPRLLRRSLHRPAPCSRPPDDSVRCTIMSCRLRSSSSRFRGYGLGTTNSPSMLRARVYICPVT